MSRRRLQRGLAADGVTHFAPIDRRRFETAKRLVSEDGVTSPDVAAAPDALLRSTHGGRATKDLLSVAQEPQRLGMPQSYARSGLFPLGQNSSCAGTKCEELGELSPDTPYRFRFNSQRLDQQHPWRRSDMPKGGVLRTNNPLPPPLRFVN